MNKTRTILTALSVAFIGCGIAQAASGPFGYDLQKDMHRSEIKAREQAAAQQNASKTTPANIKSQPTATEENVSAPMISVDEILAGHASGKDFYSFVSVKDLYIDSIPHSEVYYINPTMKSAISRYKSGNYTGCLQELYDYVRKNPNDAYAYYYMGMAYTKLGETTAAKNCYQKAINCDARGSLLVSALKGRDCLSGGGYCNSDETQNIPIVKTNTSGDSGSSEDDELDRFINAPYTGNGFSPELQKEYQQKELENLQKTINRKKELNENDFENIRRIEGLNKSEVVTGEKIAMITGSDGGLTPSDADVLDAIDVLKRAGLNISAGNFNSEVEMSDIGQTSFEKSPAVFTPNQDLQAMQMLLGNGNSQNNDPMMSMLPYMMQNDGKNIDPQVLQAMMMNSMMSGLSGLNSTDNNK